MKQNVPEIVIVKNNVTEEKSKAEARGIVCVNQTRGVFICKKCGQQWSPLAQPGGGYSRGWWKCPNGCNHQSSLTNQAILGPGNKSDFASEVEKRIQISWLAQAVSLTKLRSPALNIEREESVDNKNIKTESQVCHDVHEASQNLDTLFRRDSQRSSGTLSVAKAPTSLAVPLETGIFTAAEAAAYLGKSTKTIYNLTSKGLIRALGSRGRLRFEKKELDKFLGLKG